MFTKEETVKRILEFLNDVYLELLNSDKVKFAELMHRYGVTLKTSQLVSAGILKITGDNRRSYKYFWIGPEPNHETAVRVYNTRQYQKEKEKTLNTIEEKNENHSLDRVIAFTVLGNKYGISGEFLKCFVKEALEITK